MVGRIAMVSCDSSGTVVCWQERTPIVSESVGEITCCCSGQNCFLIASENLWCFSEVEEGQILKRNLGNINPTQCIVAVGKNCCWTVEQRTKRTRCWDIESGDCIKELSLPSAVIGCGFQLESRTVVAVATEEELQIYDQSGHLIQRMHLTEKVLFLSSGAQTMVGAGLKSFFLLKE